MVKMKDSGIEWIGENTKNDYRSEVEIIKSAILKSQSRAANNVNAELLSLYYGVGQYVSLNTRSKNNWGTGAIEIISELLHKELPGLRGFSVANLKFMRQFYETWSEDFKTLATESENVDDKSLTTVSEINTLQLVANHGECSEEFSLEVFLSFVGNQYHLEVFGEEQFPDLLFFNRELNSLVVVELKIGEFKTAYLGQLCGYLRIIDDKIKKPHENSTIGILLCKSMNKKFAEYVIQDYDKPMGIATYKSLEDMPEKLRNVLPDLNKMQNILDESTDRL